MHMGSDDARTRTRLLSIIIGLPAHRQVWTQYPLSMPRGYAPAMVRDLALQQRQPSYNVGLLAATLPPPAADWSAPHWAAVEPLSLGRWGDVRPCEWRPQSVHAKLQADAASLAVIFRVSDEIVQCKCENYQVPPLCYVLLTPDPPFPLAISARLSFCCTPLSI